MIRALLAIFRLAGLLLESGPGRYLLDRAVAATRAYDAFYERAAVWLGFQAARPALSRGAADPAADRQGSHA